MYNGSVVTYPGLTVNEVQSITPASYAPVSKTVPPATGTVIIPNWNGVHLLPSCLDALRGQTFRDFQVIVVDNASEDESVPLLEREYPEVQVVRMDQNYFFSGAVNRGIRHSRSPVVVLLNNDTEVEPRWLEELVAALDAHPEAGMAASKMLLFDRRDVLNSAGDFYGVDGVPGNRGVWEVDLGQYDNSVYVFGACAGAAAYRRSMLEDIGLLDEDFVGYCEDVDLSFRAQLAGYVCVFAPRARVYHRLSATGGGPRASYLCARNFINVIVKDVPGDLLRKYWVRILFGQWRTTWRALAHFQEPASRAWLRGQLAGLTQVRTMLAKRREVAATRRVTNAYLDSILTH